MEYVRLILSTRNKNNIKIYIVFFSFFSCNFQPEGCADEFIDINGICYFKGDLNILQTILDNSSTTKSALDIDGNGVEPLELQVQSWNNKGRVNKLWLKHDSLNGGIPKNIGDLIFLDTLNLGFNQLSGEIPNSIGNLANLNWLYLRYNHLTGKIPESICNIYPNLSNFLIEGNKLCPPYPECIPLNKIGTQDTSNCIN